MVELADRFVCAADEVWRLQRGSEPDCVFFQRAVNGGERITDRGTRQGVWILAASGRLLGRDNSHRPERVAELMERALADWERLDASGRALPAGTDLTAAHRWERSRPADGLVLERIGRELGPGAPAGERSPRWNRDYAWFSRGELGALPTEAASPEAALDWSPLARRLARFHLVDDVRGQTLPFAPEELVDASLVARVAGRDGARVRYALEGHTEALAEGPWLLGDNLWKPSQEIPHGIECALRGTAELDLDSGRFTAFELVAVGRRFGHTVNNGRWREPEPGRIGFRLVLDDGPDTIAPTFVAVYDADWIEPPAVRAWIASPAECGLDGF